MRPVQSETFAARKLSSATLRSQRSPSRSEHGEVFTAFCRDQQSIVLGACRIWFTEFHEDNGGSNVDISMGEEAETSTGTRTTFFAWPVPVFRERNAGRSGDSSHVPISK